MDIWLIGTLNELFIRGFYTRFKFQQNKVVRGKFLNFVMNPFCTSYSILTLALDRIVLYGNVAFSITVLSR